MLLSLLTAITSDQPGSVQYSDLQTSRIERRMMSQTKRAAVNVYYVLTVLHSLMTHHKNTRAKIKNKKDVFKSVYMLKEDVSP
jgi:hypothetical protein